MSASAASSSPPSVNTLISEVSRIACWRALRLAEPPASAKSATTLSVPMISSLLAVAVKENNNSRPYVMLAK
jgi:hypothetical protein